MKCINCRTQGTHFQKKLCPKCWETGHKPEDFQLVDRSDWFDGETMQEAGRKAGQFVEKMGKEKYVSHVGYTMEEAFGRWEQMVTWKEYIRKESDDTQGKGQTKDSGAKV
jgi:dissimilatory sulfite reductase (desulfoviridin) alpha/beta subunit